MGYKYDSKIGGNMNALGLIILLGIVFSGGVFVGVYITLSKKKAWWSEKFIGFVKRNTSAGEK